MTLQIDKPLLDPYDYDFHEDPYPYYKRLRDEAPLYRNEEQKFWALSRHADVVQGFRNSTTLSNKHGVSLDPISRNEHAHRVMSFLALDDRHVLHRLLEPVARLAIQRQRPLRIAQSHDPNMRVPRHRAIVLRGRGSSPAPSARDCRPTGRSGLSGRSP